MARTTSAEVLQIMDNCQVSAPIIDTLIAAANVMLTKTFSDDADIGDDLLAEMERWLAAHLIASGPERVASREKVGDADITYTGQWGKKLESTPYGQVVLQLDVTGKMANIGKKSASIRAVTSFD